MSDVQLQYRMHDTGSGSVELELELQQRMESVRMRHTKTEIKKALTVLKETCVDNKPNCDKCPLYSCECVGCGTVQWWPFAYKLDGKEHIFR